jgi:polyhydroxyalkanoate synthase
MATNDILNAENYDRMTHNIKRIDALSKRLLSIIHQREAPNLALSAPSHELFTNAGAQYWQKMLENPEKVFMHQVAFWAGSLQHFVEAQQMAVSPSDPSDPSSPQSEETDPRFAHPMWHTNPYFNLIKRQYFLNAASLRRALAEISDLDPIEKQRLEYFSTQIIDMLSPTNFLATNPAALEKAVETEGQSLIDGMENLVTDLENNNGELLVRLTDDKAFELGVNIASTPGKVVFRNRMFELIQYAPSTETVREIPLVIFPPWINKFYILDLKAQNSFIKWVTEQGYSVFVVSWINPDRSYAEVGLEEYISEGFCTAIDTVKQISGQEQVNALGYCIAGTVLSLVLALMKKRGDTSIKSATFFTTLTDFSQQREFTPFLQDDFVDGIEKHVEKDGILPSHILSRTFSFLRANDLIYRPAIKSYMLGETPPAFDLLFWNGDATGLPGKMTVQYLRCLCQQDQFAQSGISLFGEVLRLSDVTVPFCAIACETDHIAAWQDSYRGFQKMGSRSKTFILSQSGHIGGIINPPSKKKYGHYTNADLRLSHRDWQDTAAFHQGSWWSRWEGWLKKKSGKRIAVQDPGSKTFEVLCAAPGTYVLSGDLVPEK